jgi:outer membrane protein TolC
VLTLLAIAFVFPLPSRAQLSLGTVVSLAQRDSSAVKLAEADVLKADALLAESKDVYIPSLVVGSSVGPPSIGFPAGQPSIANASVQSLAFSFAQGKYVRAARAGVEAATLNLKDAREQVALDASTSYIELETINRELAASREGAQNAARLVEIERQRSEAGVDPTSELLQARLTEAQIKLKTIHLETRSVEAVSRLAALTGLPSTSIQADATSIPEIPALRPADPALTTASMDAARAQAESKNLQAQGDKRAAKSLPIISFGAQYNRDSTLLNNYSYYYAHFKADNFSAGFSIQIPLYDRGRRDKRQESAADALRATAEAEQAQRQNDLQIATLTANLRELDALAEIASLKQQIANEQLKTVQAQLETGNGQGAEPGAQPQLSPKSEQLARIDERQKFIDALDAGFDLNKTRLALIRALGHMEDWLRTLASRDTAKDPDGDTVHPK